MAFKIGLFPGASGCNLGLGTIAAGNGTGNAGFRTRTGKAGCVSLLVAHTTALNSELWGRI